MTQPTEDVPAWVTSAIAAGDAHRADLLRRSDERRARVEAARTGEPVYADLPPRQLGALQAALDDDGRYWSAVAHSGHDDPTIADSALSELITIDAERTFLAHAADWRNVGARVEADTHTLLQRERAAQRAEEARQIAERVARNAPRATPGRRERRRRRPAESLRDATIIALDNERTDRLAALSQHRLDLEAMDDLLVRRQLPDVHDLLRKGRVRDVAIAETAEELLGSGVLRGNERQELERIVRRAGERVALWKRLATVVERLEEAIANGWEDEEKHMARSYLIVRAAVDQLL